MAVRITTASARALSIMILKIMIVNLTTLCITLSILFSITALNIVALSKTATMQHPAFYFSDKIAKQFCDFS